MLPEGVHAFFPFMLVPASSPGMPLSVLIPAPVMATMFLQSLRKSARRWASAETLAELLLADVDVVGVKAWRMTRRAVLGRMMLRRRRRRAVVVEDNKEPRRGIPCCVTWRWEGGWMS